MPRSLRVDGAGVWHHVMNRAVGRRPLFEGRREIDDFFDRVARVVRERAIEVHAYAVLTTHYHLLIRSVGGRLSAAMQYVQDGFARWFNVTRDRDGPLFRGRFLSRVIDSVAYWRALVRYIDHNPVEAGIVADPSEYPFCSAHDYLRGPARGWLERAGVESFVAAAGPPDRFAIAYRRTFLLDEPLAAPAIEGLLDGRSHVIGVPLDDLVRAMPHETQRWMQERARVADGVAAGGALVAIETVLRHAAGTTSEGRTAGQPPSSSGADEQRRSILLAGMLRLMAGATYQQIATILRVSETSARRLARSFGDRCESESAFAAEAAAALSRALRATFGENPPPACWSLRAPHADATSR